MIPLIENIESHYDCSSSGEDLHKLQQELDELRSKNADSKQEKEMINRLENQIQFIKNKCDIH